MKKLIFILPPILLFSFSCGMKNKSQVEAAMKKAGSFETKEMDNIYVAYIEVNDKFENMGEHHSKLFKSKALFKFIDGFPISIYHQYPADPNAIYKYDVAVPIKSDAKLSDDVKSKIIEQGKVVSYIHIGGYENIAAVWSNVMAYVASNFNIREDTPPMERYIKGPGMLFEGNADKYVTEMIVPIEESKSTNDDGETNIELRI